MRYRLRTLLLLMAIVPPLIGFWPDIKRQAIVRAAQINASDIAVVVAASSLIAIRVRLYRTARAQEIASGENRPPPRG